MTKGTGVWLSWILVLYVNSSTTWRLEKYHLKLLVVFFSQCIKIFKSNQGLFFFCLLSSFPSPVSYSQPMIWQPLTGGSWATSHMRMKARKERTRWHQKICLSRSLVVKLTIWLPAGRLWGRGWEQHSTTVREEFCHTVCFNNLLGEKKFTHKGEWIFWFNFPVYSHRVSHWLLLEGWIYLKLA